MKVLGLLVCVLGWLIAVSCVEFSSVGVQLVVVVLGFLVAGFGALGILNSAHIRDAIWKS